ncbi:UNVERIFIED_CONTAM: Opsin-3 [Gekko kuhli]
MYSGNCSGEDDRTGSGGSLKPGHRDAEQRQAAAAAEDAGPPFSASTYELLALLIATIGLLGLCNNLLVLVLYAKFKRLRSPTNLFLVNISLSDLLVSLFGVSFTFFSCLRSRWVWDDAGCVWDGFSNSLFVCAAGNKSLKQELCDTGKPGRSTNIHLINII